MGIIKKEPEGKRKINIDGPDGNAFVLMGVAAKWAVQIGLDKEAIIEDMKSGDYNHLLKVFNEHFGMICDLETEQEHLLILFSEDSTEDIMDKLDDVWSKEEE